MTKKSTSDKSDLGMGKGRAPNARSRSGCLTCRQRHIRCDEEHPSCKTCVVGKRTCRYAPVVIPLRDRRVLQSSGPPLGQQTPWEVRSLAVVGRELPASTKMDPFDTLPIKMAYNSRELYYYFHQAGTAFARVSGDQKDDCLTLATLDEHALRSTLLVAGLHYTWNTGKLQRYEPAFLFHKVESIRNINRWVACYDPQIVAICARQISTLCLAEACLGDIDAAQTHLDGLMTFLNVHDQEAHAAHSNVIESELATRYFLLTSTFILGLKSRLKDFIQLLNANGARMSHKPSPEESLVLMDMWHKAERGGLTARLRAMRMFPSFFSPLPATRKPRGIDAWPMLAILREITTMADHRHIDDSVVYADSLWKEGAPTRLLLELVEAHERSFAKTDIEPTSMPHIETEPLMSSWCGFSATAEIYMHSVLTVVDSGEPVDDRLLHRVLLILKKDINDSWDDLIGANGAARQDYWFWKVFTGALASAKNESLAAAERIGLDDTNPQALQPWFKNCVRLWSAMTSILDWEEVKAVLSAMAWPNAKAESQENFARNVWYRAITPADL